MIKKTHISLFIIIILTSCGEQKRYTIKATFPSNYEGKKAYLYDPSVKEGPALDSSTINKGVCYFEGIATDTPTMRIVKYGADTYPATFITEKGNISLTVNPNNKMPSVHGTKLNDTYQRYMDSVDTIFGEMRKVFDKRDALVYAGKMTEDQKFMLNKEETALFNKMENLAYNYIRANTGNVLGQVGFFTESQYLSPQKIEELLPLFSDDFREKPEVREKEMLIKARLQTDTGHIYNDITGSTPDGKQIYLSDYVGKKKINLVVLDFWASWSGPCSASIPYLKALYDKYKNKGLEIVSVSLDYDMQNWKTAIKSFKMDWPQLSTMGGWNEPAAAIYGIANIPSQILIDKNGMIIARGLNEKDLSEKIDQLIK